MKIVCGNKVSSPIGIVKVVDQKTLKSQNTRILSLNNYIFCIYSQKVSRLSIKYKQIILTSKLFLK